MVAKLKAIHHNERNARNKMLGQAWRQGLVVPQGYFLRGMFVEYVEVSQYCQISLIPFRQHFAQQIGGFAQHFLGGVPVDAGIGD